MAQPTSSNPPCGQKSMSAKFAPKQLRPEWGDARVVQSLFCICKSTLYRLADEGKIRTSSLRERGKLRGKRLFDLDSISRYIEKMASGGEDQS